MERYLAIVESGIVSNLVVVDPFDQATIVHFGGLLLPSGSLVSIGWVCDGVTFSAPPKYTTLADAQSWHLAAMDAAFDSANQLPITYLNTTFQADDYSAGLLAKTITLLGATGTTSVTWWDSTNTGVSMTLAQLVGLGASIFARGQGLFARKQVQKAAIRAATTIQQVETISW